MRNKHYIDALIGTVQHFLCALPCDSNPHLHLFPVLQIALPPYTIRQTLDEPRLYRLFLLKTQTIE